MAGGLTVGLDWEALGAEVSPSLNRAHAVVIIGRDPMAVARAALGIGQAQARTRRVAIGDLIGEVEPLQRLVTDDDSHGIVDSFLYGVSLNKIARQVDDAGMMFVMPTGTDPRVTPDIMQNERWSRLASGFREAGALLLLVAPSGAEGVRELGAMLDGVVVVDDEIAASRVPAGTLLAQITAPASLVADGIVQDASLVPTVLTERVPLGTPRVQAPVMLPPQDVLEKRNPATFKSSRGIPVVPLVAAIVACAIAVWFALGRPGMTAKRATVDQAPEASPSAAEQVPQETAPPAPSALTQARDSLSALRVANPQDSAKAVPYSVVIVATNDEAQALARWADLGLKLPAGTVTMVRIRGERGRFFQMQAGAFAKVTQADSLLAALRANGSLAAGAGNVKATPYALQIEVGVSRRAGQNVADGYGQNQIAAYPLLQADNTATIFVGAFETPDQAAPLMEELKVKGVKTTLVYRTGRSF